MEAFIDWKNQRFFEDMSADIRRGLGHVVNEGYRPGGHVPTGYRVEKVEIGRRRNGEPRYGNRLVKDENIAERVALAWRMKIQANASYLAIHEAKGLFRDPRHYSAFFDNLIYAGIMVYGGKRYPLDWETGGRFCEPYVTLDEYVLVQKGRQRRDPSVTHPRIMSSTYLLTGLLFCGCCAEHGRNARLVGQTDGRKVDTRYYRCLCEQRYRGDSCTLPIIPCWRLEETVIDVLKETVLTPIFILAEVERANVLMDETDQSAQSQMPELERAVKEEQKRVESIVELIGKKGVTAILEA